MTELIDTVQLQEVGDAFVELFDITLPSGTEIYLFRGLDAGTESIYFSNKAGTTLNEYVAIPISIEGLEVSTAGASARPTLSLANIPVLTRQIASNEDTGLDILEAEGVNTNEDLLTSTVVYRSTLFKYTASSTEAASVPTEFPSATYIVDRVAGEDNLTVSFELVSPIDIEGVTLPSRVVIGKYCPWKYQGASFSAQEGGCTWPLDSAGRFFDENDNIITKDISTIAAWSNSLTYSAADKVKTTTNSHTQIWEAIRAVPVNKNPENNKSYWKRLDVCGKLINSCKLRFQGNNNDTTLNTSIPLPFGGFPGTKKFK